MHHGLGRTAPMTDSENDASRDKVIVDIVINNIYDLVEEKGLVLSRVLDAAGVNMAYLSNIKSNKSASPTITKLQRIADALHEPVSVLFVAKDKREARHRLLRIADTLDAQQLALLEDFARAMSIRSNPPR